MRPTWAQRQATCNHCKKPIRPKTKKIDRTIKLKSGKLLSQRFHLVCIQPYFNNWFKKNSYKPLEKPTGRTPSEELKHLTEEQKETRRQLISSVSAFKREFQKKLLPIFNAKPSLEGLTQKELNVFKSYNNRLTIIKTKLLSLGGLPKSTQELGDHDISAILLKNPHLES